MIHKGSGDLLRSKSLKQEMLCASCKSNKNLNSKGCKDRPVLCSRCGFECLCGDIIRYDQSLCCLEGIGPYCEACWEAPETIHCTCNHEALFLKSWQTGDATWLGGEAKC
eukprot:Filipodium_phascolosomae@DN2319_c0_g1_i3.p1